MKAFALWAGITILVFIGLFGAYHFYLIQSPRKILIAVDSSYPMKEVWPQISSALEQIAQKRYARFCLVTEKNKIHDWALRPDMDKILPYAPRNFSRLTGNAQYPEIGQAQKCYLITNAVRPEGFDGWEIIYLKN